MRYDGVTSTRWHNRGTGGNRNLCEEKESRTDLIGVWQIEMDKDTESLTPDPRLGGGSVVYAAV